MNQKHQPKTQKAFTLLELLVVMAILGLLIVLGLRTFGAIQQKSRDSRRKQDMQSISKALEIYYNDFKRYPGSAEGKIVGCEEGGLASCEWGSSWQNTTNQTLYMSELPKDPGGSQYYYLATDQGSSYSLFALLENVEDGDVATDSNGNPAYFNETYCLIDTDPVASSCNYVIMSTNTMALPEIVNNL